MKRSAIGILFCFLWIAAGASAQTSYNLNVPYVAPGTITVDGLLDETAWQVAGALVFGPTGIPGGFANEMAYGAGGNAAANDLPEQTYRFLHDGAGKIYISMESNDASIQTDTGGAAWFNISQSDGLGFFAVQIKDSAPAAFGEHTLTFYPNAGTSTVITAAQGRFAGMASGSIPSGTGWAWSFQPGTNTVNEVSDVDSGYLIEFAIDIAEFGYLATDTDIVVGIQSSDKDGAPLDEWWPWNNTFAWVYQWSNGAYVSNFSVDHLLLQPTSSVEGWDCY